MYQNEMKKGRRDRAALLLQVISTKYILSANALLILSAIKI